MTLPRQIRSDDRHSTEGGSSRLAHIAPKKTTTEKGEQAWLLGKERKGKTRHREEIQDRSRFFLRFFEEFLYRTNHLVCRKSLLKGITRTEGVNQPRQIAGRRIAENETVQKMRVALSRGCRSGIGGRPSKWNEFTVGPPAEVRVPLLGEVG